MLYIVHRVNASIYSAAAPMVTVDPPTPAATVGSPLTLSCSAIDCIRNSFTFEWRLDGVLVSSSRVRSIGSSSSQLTVDSVTTSDYGTYTCSVTNSLGTNVGTFTVVRAGMSATVHCMYATMEYCTDVDDGYLHLWLPSIDNL